MFRLMIVVLLFGALMWGNESGKQISILCYHRFAPQVNDAMTVKTSEFSKQLAWLKENGYTVIPLEMAVQYLKGEIDIIPDKPVVITVDDGHKSVYFEMSPLVKQYHIPVTLFIYPSVISHTKYAMTWEQLRELEATGLFRVESHTYWHPNFKKEKKRLSPTMYEQFVTVQLGKSKRILEEKTGHEIKYLAWAFGIYDQELESKAEQEGYRAAFTIERRHADRGDRVMSIPRYMIVDQYTLKAFQNIVEKNQ
ncbi:MAG: polysaccharide deacetylase family protein [Campylobacterales bacterium]|nr:polysaccharide deacetylase family protein [Campylobacterales bacterium]